MEEQEIELKTVTKPRISRKKLLRNSTIAILAIAVGYIHYKYVINLFENDRNFSYLSELEREMSLRTEMGFYYSYFKTVVEERPFVAGINKIMNDKVVEYPNEVNAFNRFNIIPEVIIGGVYRYFEASLNTTAHRQCHMVHRGNGLSPVESCIGYGEPMLFYLEAVWWLAGLTAAGVFMQAVALSESIAGGLFAILQYIANHAECTRVQWAPNERENFAMPLILLHTWLVTMQLACKENRAKIYLQISIFMINCACLLFWQFSQFIFLTHVAIFFLMEQLKIIDAKTLSIYLHSQFCGLHVAVLLLQGNDMLKSSLYASFFLAVSTYCLLFSSFRVKVRSLLDFLVESWLVLLRICLIVCLSVCLKRIISDFLEVDEDSHVWDILYSKFGKYKSFHTLIYTCSEVFDFLPFSSIRNMFDTFLLPIVGFIVTITIARWFITASENSGNALRKKEIEDAKKDEKEKDSDTDKKETEDIKKDEKERDSDTDDSGIENTSEFKIRKRKVVDLNDIDKEVKKIEVEYEEATTDKFVSFLQHLNVEPAVFYNLSQLVVYGVMAGLIMRLKLLFTTQLCIVASLFFSSKNYSILPKSISKYLPIFWIITLTPVLMRLIVNVSEEISHIGEFSDIQQEQLLQWISSTTGAGAAFAGSMPILAAVMLSTRRPIVIHPHYENAAARRRVYSVYKMYGKFTPEALYKELTALRVTYLIVETKYCYGKSSKGCSFESIWDVETPHLADNKKLCHTLLSERVDNFYRLFSNKHYSVFTVHDFSVRYMPRSFDT